ncbi:HD domain-containing protein [Clostridium botulinum]|uniref:HD domain-containing protein n=1 Tax=Clostridium botulinum TaxID=1491 RepID=UPI0007732E52|nr:HD domain-containing protein [Clostridium botulinum]
MTIINKLESIKDTTLWKRLNCGFLENDDDVARILATNLLTICDNAKKRMKKFPSLHSQYTLHDEIHLLRVTEIMAKIISEQVLDLLNPIEVALLILSAFYHDQGMVLDDKEVEQLQSSNEFKLFKEDWIIEHPNFNDIQKRVNDNNFSKEEKERCIKAYAELQDALLTDYIRINHGEASKNYVYEEFKEDSLWEVNGINIADYVGKLCKSHNEDIGNINEFNGFRVDENIATYKVNMKFLAVILRLADILDFDRDRTPDSIYKTIHFSNNVSLIEWEKHRAVCGWEISKDAIRFTMKCEHPIYHRAALQFMDWIDEELIKSHNLIKNFPAYVDQYKLYIPTSVDRSRIEAKNNCYIYHDLEFSLSRDEIVKLLMTEDLYESSSICVRELLQNSLDALRHRKCIFKRELDTNWNNGKVQFKHEIDEYGREIVMCVDNGIGMDEKIITNFLTKAGRSYYKSPEFLKDRESLASSGINFDPCSQFGIGFMSCFMLGDTIIIKTRRDYGYSIGKGKPLIVEINGLNGIVVLKKGEEDQAIGTSIKIIGRNKPPYLDRWSDKVKLIEVLNGYALGCEFEIEAECSIDEIKDKISITNKIVPPKTFIEMEKLNENSYKTFEQNLSEVNKNLNGMMRVSLLIDDNGKFTLENAEAKWDNRNSKERNKFVIKKDIHRQVYAQYLDKTCCDGILVCGTPGNGDRILRLGERANVVHAGIESFLIDIRGNIKPALTPSRIPKEGHSHPSWKRVQGMIDIAQGMLWGKILEEINTKEEIEIFIKLTSIYRVNLENISHERIWNKLFVPFQSGNDKIQWIKLSEVDRLKMEKESDEIKLYLDKYNFIKTNWEIKSYDEESYGSVSDDNITRAIISISSIDIENNEVFLKLERPNKADLQLSKYKIEDSITRVKLLKYNGEASNYIVVQTPVCTANRDHSLVRYVFENKFNKNEDILIEFARGLIIFLNDKKDILDIINSKVSRRMHRLGCLYSSIRWDDYSDEFKSTYKVWNEEVGTIVITADDFNKWKDTKPYDLEIW